MKRSRQSLALLAGGVATAAALLGAPIAAAEEYGGGGANNPLLPGCEVEGGGGATGGQSTDCASPGNMQLTATPNDIGLVDASIDNPGWGGFGGW
jgi:hypothetical protein